MHEYIFKMKKGDIEIELKSDDLEFDYYDPVGKITREYGDEFSVEDVGRLAKDLIDKEEEIKSRTLRDVGMDRW